MRAARAMALTGLMATRDRTARWQRSWDKHARSYDREMAFWDRRLFGDSREWACSQASGRVLEVAVGTGLNIGLYPDDVTLTGIDLSSEMLALARTRAAELGRDVDLLQGNAHALPFGDGSFDTVVCTFGLCAIPDDDAALGQMARVLAPGGRLILVDHVASTSRAARLVQRLLEVASVPLAGEHFLRRPRLKLPSAGLELQRAERFKLGLVERLVAAKA
jgi:ubiquinone/menaquinone biosynthesis C-methylase UbiE